MVIIPNEAIQYRLKTAPKIPQSILAFLRLVSGLKSCNITPPINVNKASKIRIQREIASIICHFAKYNAALGTGCVSISFQVSYRCSKYTFLVTMMTRKIGKKNPANPLKFVSISLFQALSSNSLAGKLINTKLMV